MISSLRILVPVIAVGFLAACGTSDIAQMDVQGGAYERGLRDGYVKLADEEYEQTDLRSGRQFAERAQLAAMGKPPAPEAITERKLVAPHLAELTQARARLMAAFDKGARQKVGSDAATAQVMFDCWMEQAEENIQPADIDRCKKAFLAAMGRIDGALGMPAVAQPSTPVVPSTPRSERFVVYFATNSAVVDDAAMKTIHDAASKAKATKANNVFVVGHTDRVGSPKANEVLADKRANAVAEALTKSGVSKNAVATIAEGEVRPAVTTRDGVAERRNRRVEITVVY